MERRLSNACRLDTAPKNICIVRHVVVTVEPVYRVEETNAANMVEVKVSNLSGGRFSVHIGKTKRTYYFTLSASAYVCPRW